MTLPRRAFFARIAALAAGAVGWAGWRGRGEGRIVWPTKFPDFKAGESVKAGQLVALDSGGRIVGVCAQDGSVITAGSYYRAFSPDESHWLRGDAVLNRLRDDT